jgi:hypothetical protein
MTLDEARILLLGDYLTFSRAHSRLKAEELYEAHRRIVEEDARLQAALAAERIENARLRERINDDRLYLSSCVANLTDMAGTPWYDGLKRITALEADYDGPTR